MDTKQLMINVLKRYSIEELFHCLMNMNMLKYVYFPKYHERRPKKIKISMKKRLALLFNSLADQDYIEKVVDIHSIDVQKDQERIECKMTIIRKEFDSSDVMNRYEFRPYVPLQVQNIIPNKKMQENIKNLQKTNKAIATVFNEKNTNNQQKIRTEEQFIMKIFNNTFDRIEGEYSLEVVDAVVQKYIEMVIWYKKTFLKKNLEEPVRYALAVFAFREHTTQTFRYFVHFFTHKGRDIDPTKGEIFTSNVRIPREGDFINIFYNELNRIIIHYYPMKYRQLIEIISLPSLLLQSYSFNILLEELFVYLTTNGRITIDLDIYVTSVSLLMCSTIEHQNKSFDTVLKSIINFYGLPFHIDTTIERILMYLYLSFVFIVFQKIPKRSYQKTTSTVELYNKTLLFFKECKKINNMKFTSWLDMMERLRSFSLVLDLTVPSYF